MVKTYKYNILSINVSNIFFFKCEVKFASNTAYKYDCICLVQDFPFQVNSFLLLISL